MNGKLIRVARVSAFLSILHFLVLSAGAQTTQFTYQGRLLDNGIPANGIYDLEFRLFNVSAGGTQIGSTAVVGGVQVSNGVFSVSLDFGDLFPGEGRWLEISIAPEGQTPTLLEPRQGITSAPYAMKSRNSDTAENAIELDGVPAGDYVLTTDTRLSNARPPTAGSSFYIQNGTNPQSANFYVTGTGSASVLNAWSQYNLGGLRILDSTPSSGNLYVGAYSGTNVTTGTSNSFFGTHAGEFTTEGILNSFFGRYTGRRTTVGDYNSFYGYAAGASNVSGNDNSFFGSRAGYSNTSSQNSFFGSDAGYNTTTGGGNSFFGFLSGYSNTSGQSNSFFGVHSGSSNTIGNHNSFFGRLAGNATTEGGSNSFFGSGSGFQNTTGSSNAFFGTNAGNLTSTGSSNTFIGANAGNENTTGTNNTYVGRNAGSQATGSNVTLIGAETTSGSGLSYATAIGAGSFVGSSNTIVLGRTNGSDLVKIYGFASGGSTSVCRNGYTLSNCSSSLRYKENVETYRSGLNIIGRLRPITFDWKEGGMHDLGLGAEDVAEVEPLLVTYNRNGEVEGVKYDRIAVVLLNAVREQQEQIERQRTEIETLRSIICEIRPSADGCGEEQ